MWGSATSPERPELAAGQLHRRDGLPRIREDSVCPEACVGRVVSSVMASTARAVVLMLDQLIGAALVGCSVIRRAEEVSAR